MASSACYFFNTAIDCGSLPAPENGNIVLSDTTFRSTARYSCEAGFGLVGVSVRTCEASGEWSGTAPFCQSEYKMYRISVEVCCLYK